MLPSWYLLVPILLPVIGGLVVGLCDPVGKKDRPRTWWTGSVLALSLLSVLPVLFSPALELPLFRLSDNLPVFLRSDDTGKYFAAVMSFVWCMAGFYSFGYLKGEEHLPRYYAFTLITMGVLMALCFSGNIITYYMCYELMTLLTVPLVMHEMTPDSVAAGIKYLIFSVIGASLVLLGIFQLAPYMSSWSFAPGGILDAEKVAGHENTVVAIALIMALGFGTKAGMFPLHGWLPTAHPVAPASASAVLSGIITKAGVLGILRSVYFLIGPDLLRGSWMQITWMVLTLLTVFMGSLLAFRENLLKKRLAWSSVSQVSYVLFGLSTMHPVGVVGALLHVAAHALIKNTLFMSAGSIIRQTKHTRVEELEGIGKRMPVTMWCFTLVSVGLVGIPPCLGFVSKWYLAQGALSMSGVPGFFSWLAPAILLISALLTAGYLLTVSIRAFFPGKKEHAPSPVWEKCEAPWIMLVPMLLLTALSILLGIFPGALIRFFEGLAGLVM